MIKKRLVHVLFKALFANGKEISKRKGYVLRPKILKIDETPGEIMEKVASLKTLSSDSSTSQVYKRIKKTNREETLFSM